MDHSNDAMTATVSQLAQAFEAWENGFRAEPSSFMTPQQCADAQVSELSASRAAYFWQLLRVTPGVDYYPNLMKDDPASRLAYYESRVKWGDIKPSSVDGEVSIMSTSTVNAFSGQLKSADMAAPGPAAPHLAGDQDGLSPNVEARLAEEVHWLGNALRQFGSRAQAIGNSPAATGNLDKLVSLTLALVGLQLANSFLGQRKGFGLLACSVDYLEQLHLNLGDLFREIDLDGRRFLAVALCDQGGDEVLQCTQGGNDGAELNHEGDQ